jgi:ubiquinone/menaquinone biosynthesis C-methylase UbiE
MPVRRLLIHPLEGIQMKKQNSATKNWFKTWANEYDNTLGKIKRHHKLLDLVVASSSVKNNHRVLDIGCGTGLLSLKFLQRAHCIIHGIDNSPEMLKIFKEKIDALGLSENITCELQDAETLDHKKNYFDIIASTVTLHHVKNKYPMIRTIYTLLKPGGRFIVGDIDMDTTGDPRDPKRLLKILDYLKEEYALALKEGGIEAFNRMYDNGRKHILNDGEYCIDFTKWNKICEKAKFKKIIVRALPEFEWFKVLIAIK